MKIWKKAVIAAAAILLSGNMVSAFNMLNDADEFTKNPSYVATTYVGMTRAELLSNFDNPSWIILQQKGSVLINRSEPVGDKGLYQKETVKGIFNPDGSLKESRIYFSVGGYDPVIEGTDETAKMPKLDKKGKESNYAQGEALFQKISENVTAYLNKGPAHGIEDMTKYLKQMAKTKNIKKAYTSRWITSGAMYKLELTELANGEVRIIFYPSHD